MEVGEHSTAAHPVHDRDMSVRLMSVMPNLLCKRVYVVCNFFLSWLCVQLTHIKIVDKQIVCSPYLCAVNNNYC